MVSLIFQQGSWLYGLKLASQGKIAPVKTFPVEPK